MAEIFSFNEAVVAAANAFIATGGLTPTFSDVTITGGTTTTNNPVLDMTQTWNNGAVAFTGAKLNVTDTASAAGSLLMDLQVGGTTQFSISKNGSIHAVNTVASYGAGGFYSRSNLGGISIGTSDDVVLRRDAANILALRNGTSTQAFNLYETYTDASNYSRMAFGYGVVGAGYYSIQTQAGGTGTNRNFLFDAAGGLSRLTMNTSGFVFGSSTNDWWKITSAGHFIAGTDNTYDIGASGANRPRNIYVGSGITAGGSITSASNVQAGTSGNLIFGSSTVISAPTNGAILVRDGGNTVSFTITPGAGNLAQFNGVVTASSFSSGSAGYIGWSGTKLYMTSPADAVLRLNNAAATITTDITLSGANGSGGSTATFGGSIVSAFNVFAGSAQALGFTNRSLISSSADGLLRLSNQASTDFTRLILGTNDASGSAIKKNGTGIDIRRGDDSAYSDVVAGSMIAATGALRSTATTVSGLGSAATFATGARRFVTDANATMAAGAGTVVVGGGSNRVPVYSDGTDWLIG